jgi:hypothetical protein
MSYTVTKFVLESQGLTPSEKAVAHSLAYHAHADGTKSFPSMVTIAIEAGLSDRRAAQRVVRRLEEKGLIVADGAKSGGRYKATHYRFDLEYSGCTVAVTNESATVVDRNSDPGCTKQRLYGRPKGYERSDKDQIVGADRAGLMTFGYDSDDPYGQLLRDEDEIISTIREALTQWVKQLRPLPPFPRKELTEDEAARAFHAVSELLLNGAAKLFGTARASTSTLVDYDRVWDLEQKYGPGTTAALAKAIIAHGVGDSHSYAISVRTFVWTHLCDAATATSSPTN